MEEAGSDGRLSMLLLDEAPSEYSALKRAQEEEGEAQALGIFLSIFLEIEEEAFQKHSGDLTYGSATFLSGRATLEEVTVHS
jgi:hypothetical protein